MAGGGIYSSARPSASSTTSLSSIQQSFITRLLLLLTLLPLTLAAFAFVLQWRGGLINDPTTRWSPDKYQFPGGMGTSNPPLHNAQSSSSDCFQLLSRSASPSFPYYRDWKLNFDPNLKPKICITTSTSADLEQILPWIFYHKVVGVTTFFLFVEGKAASPNVTAVLESIPGLKLIYRTRELEEKQAKSRIWNETWLSSFFYKPCNYELFVKQSLNMEMAIVMARDADVDWIIHLDTDELLHPAGAREYSLRQLLSDVPRNVDMVIFPNYESSVERDDIKEPFTEVSMFKKNYDHLPKDTYFGMYKEAIRNNPNYFLTYGNGKSAARIQDHLRPNGAHRWHNYMKTPNEIKLEEAAVLHYTYPKFSDLVARRDRCSCKPTTEDVKRCFMLEFDRSAFIIASTGTTEEMRNWYREHVVWTDKSQNLKLLRKGVLTRIYTPMSIVKGLREAGVFRSVIQSALTHSKSKFLSSIESSNSSRGSTGSEEVSLRKMGGRKEESKATARKILEIEYAGYHAAAVGPQSPPGMVDIHLEE
ncbi:hypothetical protein MKX01_036500 [Papaver californicum]|nr:hypothetical protein MKX01_036500 [Papaver californicum]